MYSETTVICAVLTTFYYAESQISMKMLLLVNILISLYASLCVIAYTNSLFNLITSSANISGDCSSFRKRSPVIKVYQELAGTTEQALTTVTDLSFSNVSNKVAVETDPFEDFELTINRVLFSNKLEKVREKFQSLGVAIKNDTNTSHTPEIDKLAHFPSGNAMRSEVFQNKSGVHLPPPQWMHRGHCFLNTTKDYMQTAINAFAIFLEGTIDDVLRLPPMYVLRSARTIAMMKIAREKLTATWKVVKGNRLPWEITFQTLEYYRPLFKYINGREMSRLNLHDDRILSYIGTHADLNRHQVGVIASRYITVNKNWQLPRYLNLMNNLLCGVPMKFMRRIPENIYLQLSHQLFYHIKACDPLQRRFYLAMMTRTQVLGKSNSWSARDVARLGLLLTEVDGPELGAINPEAMGGVTSQVMMEMSAHNLIYLTKTQLRYLAQKPLNILTKKINSYQDKLQILN